MSSSVPAPSVKEAIVADLAANPRNPKAQLVMALFRVAHAARGAGERPRVVSIPIGIVYRVFADWILGIELPWKTTVGPGLSLDHGIGLVVHDRTVIGAGVSLRHGVTLGKRYPDGGCPVIGDGVDVGSGAQILGGISIGAGAVIGAGAIVIGDVPAGAVAVGNPARVIDRVARDRDQRGS